MFEQLFEIEKLAWMVVSMPGVDNIYITAGAMDISDSEAAC